MVMFDGALKLTRSKIVVSPGSELWLYHTSLTGDKIHGNGPLKGKLFGNFTVYKGNQAISLASA